MLKSTITRGCEHCLRFRSLAPHFSQARFFSEKANHYEVLGVQKEASDKEIKAAFVRLSKKWHPDRNSDKATHDKFIRISEAYRVLSKPSSRKNYDISLKGGVPPGGSYNAGQRQEADWRGKAYWQWTPEEEEAYRSHFYNTYGAGKYGVPRPTEIDVKGRNKALMFCLGLVGFGVLFQLVRWQWIYNVYLEDRQNMTNRLKEQKRVIDKRRVEMDRRLQEHERASGNLKEDPAISKEGTVPDVNSRPVDLGASYNLSSLQDKRTM